MSTSEEQRAVVLFDKVDTDHNDHLTQQELDGVFLLFDTDNDTVVTPAEFAKDWTDLYHIGGPQEAQSLFARADLNDDNQITTADLPGIFKYFDVDGDGTVNLSEFLTQWGELTILPVRPHDISVTVG
ncbi:hypothetical protein ACJMK2_039341 [Sinanodonta woodiana]|uniref:EF-hand domain-containing protein n=1 Tax=Sinanodonta woodiana TaxID=1069815 RepID=A0ABD3WBQ3_SINWO